eukprot:scaffold3100_cov403-Prasinococcus_capsulatus_cf.AAC.8
MASTACFAASSAVTVAARVSRSPRTNTRASFRYELQLSAITFVDEILGERMAVDHLAASTNRANGPKMARSARRSMIVRAADDKEKAEKMDLDLDDMNNLFDKAVEDDAAKSAEAPAEVHTFPTRCPRLSSALLASAGCHEACVKRGGLFMAERGRERRGLEQGTVDGDFDWRCIRRSWGWLPCPYSGCMHVLKDDPFAVAAVSGLPFPAVSGLAQHGCPSPLRVGTQVCVGMQHEFGAGAYLRCLHPVRWWR